MSKGVLGEQIWLSRQADADFAHHALVLRNLIIAIAIGSLILSAGLATLNLAVTMTGLTLAMTAKLWFLDRMVWLYFETEEGCTGAGNSLDEHQH